MAACLVPLLSLLAAGPPDGSSLAIASTMVRLDFEAKSLAEIAEAIDKRGPNRIVIAPDPASRATIVRLPGDAIPAPGTFRVVEPEPLPFWAAMDRIGRATGTRAVAESWQGGARVAFHKTSPGRGFAANEGACRITLDGLSYGRAVTYAPFFHLEPGRLEIERPRLGDRSGFNASLTLMVEPRLTIARVEAVGLDEATDDRGRSLVLDAEVTNPEGIASGDRPSAARRLVVPLRYPADPGTTIRRLRGSVRFRAGNLPAPGPPGRVVTVPFKFSDVPMP